MNKNKFYLSIILLFLSIVTILPYTSKEATVRIEGYTYSSQAAMLSTQNILLPQDRDVQREFHFFEHPLLFKWMQALVFKAFGISEFTSKMLVATLSISLILILFWFGSIYFSTWVGFISGIFLLISPRYMVHSSLCLLDIPLIFFITTAILLAIHASFSEKKYFYTISGLMIGCAILTKGAFGLLPIPVILFHLIISRKWKDFINPFFLIGACAPYGFVLLYNFLLSFNHPDLSLQSFWRTQGYAPVQEPFFYLLTLFKKYFYLLIPAIAVAFSVILSSKSSRREGSQSLNPQNKNIFYTLLFWTFCVMVALTYVKSKKQGYYMLPLNPALALLAAVGLVNILKEKYLNWIAYGTLSAALLMSFIFSTTPLTLHKSKLLREVDFWKQYGVLDWKLKNILSQHHVIYYSHGFHYVLNFRYPKEFGQKLFLPIKHLSQPNEPFYLLIDKNQKIDLPNLRVIDETQNLLLLSK